jgi:hypothetical protein
MQRTIKKLDYLILALAMFLGITIFCRFCFFCDEPVLRPEAVFPAPTRLLPAALDHKIPKMKLNATLNQKKSAEIFFLQSCHCLDKANFVQATHFIDQAIALDPGNRKYHRVALIAKAELINRKSMDKIIDLVNRRNFNEAWQTFSTTCKDNYLFYSRYALEYTHLLQKHELNASAAMLLRALQNQNIEPRGRF